MRNKIYMKIWDRTTLYTIWIFFNLNRVNTQRLYQNRLVLQPVRIKKYFQIKINVHTL